VFLRKVWQKYSRLTIFLELPWIWNNVCFAWKKPREAPTTFFSYTFEQEIDLLWNFGILSKILLGKCKHGIKIDLLCFYEKIVWNLQQSSDKPAKGLSLRFRKAELTQLPIVLTSFSCILFYKNRNLLQHQDVSPSVVILMLVPLKIFPAFS